VRTREQLAAIVQAAQAGDEIAFAELVARFQDIAVAYATSVLRDVHLAEDVAQESFLDAFRALPDLREPAAFAAWFRRIVFKQCDRVLRRAASDLSNLDAAATVATPEMSALEALELQELRRALARLVADLAPAEQEAVLLYYMGDHSQAAIAEFLGVTPNTIKTRLYSARLSLRAHMSDLEKHLDSARPSKDARFAEVVRRMIQPEALKQKKPWLWSPGIGTDVWELFCASMVGDLETVKALVDKDPSLVRANYEYRTPLSFAVMENQLAVAEYLLDQGAAAVKLGDPITMATDRGYTQMAELLERKYRTLHRASVDGEPLAELIRAGDLAGVRRLLDASPKLLHAGDRDSNQPIHWAVMTRQPEIIDELLSRGADIDAARFDGARPIHLTNGDYSFRGWRDVLRKVPTPDDIYRHLVARGAYVDGWMAARKGDIDRVRELIDADPTLVNRNNEYNSYYTGSGSVLSNAAAGNHLDIVRLLLERGADPNFPQEGIAPHGGALYAAVGQDNYEMAKLLLDRGAYPNPPVESSADAIWIAIRDGNLRMVQLLASFGAVWDIPIDLRGKLRYEEIAATGLVRPMKILAYYGDVATARPLLEVNPHLADDPESLTQAAEQGRDEFVRMLLEFSPDAARRVTVSKPRRMAELLFAHGMDPNRPNWFRITPLHRFARHGDVESAAVYLDHGADIEAVDGERDSTPLAWAAMDGQTRMVKFLLSRGARVSPVAGPSWARPIEWAKRRGHDAIVKILAEYERSGRVQRPTRAEYEALAADLAAAFGGDEPALKRIIAHFRLERPMTWDRPSIEEQVSRLRRAIRDRLINADRQVDGLESALTLDDARHLIARSEGFADWPTLVSLVG
jgi:RNA polymerase sigma factor (sigma-70 family)